MTRNDKAQQLSLGVLARSRKPDERRLPIHPAHFDRIDRQEELFAVGHFLDVRVVLGRSFSFDLFFLGGIVIFLFGLISEQIASLRFRGPER